MRQFGVAVIGSGFIGPVHVEALRRAGQKVVGILGSTPEKSDRAAALLGVPRGYRDLDELLADPAVESVHITTPNRSHFPMAKTALLAGKHVLCEKPLAMTSEESNVLVEIAKGSGLGAGVAYNIRFYPLCLHLRDLVGGSDFGRLLSVTGSYVQDWLLYDTDYNWRVLAEEGGDLRAVSDIGTHWLDLVQSITGQHVTQVLADLGQAHSVRKRPSSEVETFTGKLSAPEESQAIEISTEDMGCILLRFENGAKGTLFVSQATAGRKNALRLEISGTSAAACWESENPNELWIGHRDRPNEVLVRDPALMSAGASRFTSYPGGHAEGFPDTFKQLFKAFYGAIESGGATDYPTFADGHQEILLCEAILESHRIGSWVSVPAG